MTRVLVPRSGRDGPGNKILGKSAEITLRQALKVRSGQTSVLRSAAHGVPAEDADKLRCTLCS